MHLLAVTLVSAWQPATQGFATAIAALTSSRLSAVCGLSSLGSGSEPDKPWTQ